LISYGISGLCYIIGSYIWKPQIVPADRAAEFSFKWEELGKMDG